MANVSIHKPENMLHWLSLYRLYLSAFPREERKPFSIIYRMYRRGKSDVWRICRDNRMVGLATTVNGEGLVLLDYFAVAEKLRGRGVGSQALQLLQQKYDHVGFFGEIESTHEDAPNRELRLRRLEFYRRGGMEPLDVHAEVFGVKMELLGSRCSLTFADYRDFYEKYYSPWAAKHILEDETYGKRTDA